MANVHYFPHYSFPPGFFFGFFVVCCSHRRSVLIKKTYLANVDWSAQNTPLPFLGPWWPFWIFEVLKEERIKLNNLKLDLFPDWSTIISTLGQPFRIFDVLIEGIIGSPSQIQLI